jgi:hypothetical protein
MTSSREEPQFLLGIECSHSQILRASKLMKPARRDYNRNPYFLCPSCHRRKWGAYSIDPVHKGIAVTAIPQQQQQPRRRMKRNDRMRVLTKTTSTNSEEEKEKKTQ